MPGVNIMGSLGSFTSSQCLLVVVHAGREEMGYALRTCCICHEPYSTPSLCHLNQISFRPSQTFHQCFHHFRHFQTLHHFVAPSLVTRRFVTRHPSPVTRHPSHRHTVIPSPLFFIISFRHYRPSLFQISSAPLKFRASFSVMWLDDHHLTSLHSCGEQLFYCSSDLMTSFLVILYS